MASLRAQEIKIYVYKLQNHTNLYLVHGSFILNAVERIGNENVLQILDHFGNTSQLLSGINAEAKHIPPTWPCALNHHCVAKLGIAHLDTLL